MRALLLLLAVLMACSDAATSPTVCEGLHVHYRAAMALQARGEAVCEPVEDDPNGAWTCDCSVGSP